MFEKLGFSSGVFHVTCSRFKITSSCKFLVSVHKHDAISNKILPKIKTDPLKFELEIVEALAASPPTDKIIFPDDEDNSVVIQLTKRSKSYDPLAIHIMPFILAIPG
ncbi:hypothetical protein TNCV_3801291 [Trichonephila clavipes]|nr:hypothetical protein TNCV_3801291 [Trichonephila clavipes]